MAAAEIAVRLAELPNPAGLPGTAVTEVPAPLFEGVKIDVEGQHAAVA